MRPRRGVATARASSRSTRRQPSSRAAVALLALLLAACAPPPLPSDPLPGAPALPPATSAALAAAWQQRDNAEPVRTRHLRENGDPKYTNRLLLEASPYLRQHAHNPVDWHPWGDEAFEKARRLNRPVLLSIGYSTCHWCHVMEEESFEDEEIARFLNEHYVAVKVDREQRPDLDSIYMTAVQSMTGRGGWPMTVWLTADREPFHGGTYFPARDGDRGARTGFLTLLARLADLHASDTSSVASRAADLAERIRRALAPAGRPTEGGPPGDAVLEAALRAAATRFDSVHGGTLGAPKFPSSLPLRALLRLHRRGGNEQALRIVTTTLDGIAAGGIRDHLAGGFHRYSVDQDWLVPHFEKMLYDNALLTILFVEAWQATGRREYADVAREVLAWVEREMTSPDGGFYSATDADSAAPGGERVEGWYFTWTPAETAEVLGDAAAKFNAVYGVAAPGHLDGRSVLHLAPDSQGGSLADDPDLSASRELLLAARQRRPPPLRDDKVLTSWNGLMISAAARAALAFGDARYREMGTRAADVALGDFARRGRLVRSRLGEREQPEAFLEDYAFLAAGLLDLYEAGDGEGRLEQAIALDRVLKKDFEDPAGGFFLTPAGRTDLLVREKPIADGAEPSGNSVAILNLLRLAEFTGEQSYRDRAERALAGLAPVFERGPLAVGEALLALDFANDAPKEIVLVTDGDRATLRPFLDAMAAAFVPNRVVLAATNGAAPRLELPLLEDKLAIDGRPTAYVCEGRVCDLPTRDAAIFASQLERTRPLQAAGGETPVR